MIIFFSDQNDGMPDIQYTYLSKTINMNSTLKPAQTIWNDWFDDKWFNEPMLRKIEKAFPAVNIKKGDKNYHLELEAPGFKKEDIKVTTEHDMLIISAETKAEKSEETEKYTRKEFSRQSFKRAFYLPDAIEVDKINAGYENGIIKIDVPFTEIKTGSKKEIVVQ